MNADPRRKTPGARNARRFAAFATAVCVLMFVAGAAGAGDPAVSFAPGPEIPAGPSPHSAAVADLNRDGKLDLAVGNGGYDPDVRILLGDGAGGFVPVGAPIGAGGLVADADFNGDGIADLAVGSAGRLEILLGNGAGGFTSAPRSPVTVKGEPVSITVADLNRDGKADLVVPVYDNDLRIAVLLGDGAGGLTAAEGSPLPVGRSDFIAVVARDFNGDAKPDLAIADDGANEIFVRLGDGSGGFGPASSVLVVRAPGPLTAADVDGDGKADLLAVVAKGTVVLLGNGAGGFRPAGAPHPAGGDDITVADFNGDGKLDFATANGEASRIAVLLGDGAGGFAPVALSPFAAYATRQVATGDFNGDGKTDILALSYVGEPWWPAPRTSAILLQTAAAPQLGSARAAGARPAVFSTRGTIKLLAANGRQAAVLTGRVKGACGPVVVWTAPRRVSKSFKPGYLGCSGDGVSELALGGGQVAWIEEGGGNNLELYVMAAKLSGKKAREVEYASNGDRAGGDPTGDWVGLLLGGGSLLAYNDWAVVCAHSDPDEGYCQEYGIGQRRLVRISGARGSVVKGGPGSYPLEAVGGGRMAVESAGVVQVLAPNGSTVTSIPAANDDPPRALALDASRLAVERTFTLDLYDAATGSRTQSLQLGPAAALRLAGVNSKVALLRGPHGLVLVRLSDEKLVSLPLRSAGRPIVDIRLTDAGLFYAYNLPRAAAKGRLVFLPTASLLARF
ncbi:MAG: FG-GAP repeat domain-containing protein [Solirubrobacterales bacterium]